MPNNIEILVKADDKASATLAGISQKAGASFSALKVGALAAGAGIVAGFGMAVKSAMDFESQLSAIQAVSGATAVEMQQISDKAKQIGKDTSFSASQAAGAMEELIKAGISTADVLGGAADAAVAMAAAGGVTIPEAATLGANAMNLFGLAAKDMNHIADLVAGAANASAIDMREFGFSLSMVGAVANQAGISFDDTATAIAMMGNAGIKGSDAGTSLKTMLLNLTPSSDNAAEAFRKLGIITDDGGNRFFDASGKAKGLADISEILKQGVSTLSQEEATMALKVAFGTDAIRAAAVMSKTGAEGFKALNAEIMKTSAADVAAIRMKNMKGSVEALKGSLETVSISIGEKLIPTLNKGVQGLTEMVNKFMLLPSPIQTAVVAMAGLSGGFALMLPMLPSLVSGITLVRGALSALTLQTALATGGLTLLVGAIALIATNETAKNKIIEIGSAIANVGNNANTAALQAEGFNDKLHRFPVNTVAKVNDIARALKGTGDAAVITTTQLQGGEEALWNLPPAASAAERSVASLTENAIKPLKLRAKDIADYLTSDWGPVLSGIMAGVSKSVKEELGKAASEFPPLKMSAADFENYLSTTFGPETAKAFQKLYEEAKKSFDGMITGLQSILPAMNQSFADWKAALEQQILDYANFKANLQIIWDVLSTQNSTFASNMIDAIRQKGPAYAAQFAKFFQEDPAEALRLLAEAAPTLADQTGTAIVNTWAGYEPEAKRVGYNLGVGLSSGLRDSMAEAQQAAAEVGGTVIDEFGNIFIARSPSQVMVKLGQDIIEGLMIGLEDIVAQWFRFRDALYGLTQGLARDAAIWGNDIGWAFDQGVAAGLYAGGSGVVSAAVWVVLQAIAAARAASQTASPSKLWMGLGKQWMEGLGQGIAQAYNQHVAPMVKAASTFGNAMYQTGGGMYAPLTPALATAPAGGGSTSTTTNYGPVTVSITINGNADGPTVQRAARDGVYDALRSRGLVQ